MLRGVLAVVLGVVLGGLIVFGVEMLGHILYPHPEGLDPQDREAVRAYVATAPTGALLMVLAGWFLGTLGGATLAARLSRRVVPAYVVGAIQFAAGVLNLLMLGAHPWWFWLPGLLVFPAAAWLASRTVPPAPRDAAPTARPQAA